MAPTCCAQAFVDMQWATPPLLQSGQFHLVYLSAVLAQVGLSCQHPPLQAAVSRLVSEAGRILGIPYAV